MRKLIRDATARSTCAAWALLLLLCGCGRSDLVPVSGTVTFQNQPIKEGRIGFHPEEGRPAYGDVRDGKFTLTTYEPGDGALRGTHRVTVHADTPKDPGDPFSDRIPLIPARYQNLATSGLSAEVDARRSDWQFDLQP